MNLVYKIEDRILKLVTDANVISDTINADTLQLIPDDEWAEHDVAIQFRSNQYAIDVPLKDWLCNIPREVLKAPCFYFTVWSKTENRLLASKEERVAVIASGLQNGQAPLPPSLTIYDDIIGKTAKAENTARSAKINATKANKTAKEAKEKTDEINERIDNLDLKGKDGKDGKDGINGIDGDDGHTPVKGVDYFTPEDIEDLNIPVKLSQMENDTYFIDRFVTNLKNYYPKETIDEIIGSLGHLTITVFDELPEVGIANVLYLLTTRTTHVYDQYMWIGEEWANLGNTKIDLSNYTTFDDVNNIISLLPVDGINIIIGNSSLEPLILEKAEPGLYYFFTTIEMTTNPSAIYLKLTAEDTAAMQLSIIHGMPFVILQKIDGEMVTTNQRLAMYLSSNLSLSAVIVAATGTLTTVGISSFVGTHTDNTIYGLKTFDKLPQSSIIPIKDEQLTNKAYVDGLIDTLNAKIEVIETDLQKQIDELNTLLTAPPKYALRVQARNVNTMRADITGIDFQQLPTFTFLTRSGFRQKELMPDQTYAYVTPVITRANLTDSDMIGSMGSRLAIMFGLRMGNGTQVTGSGSSIMNVGPHGDYMNLASINWLGGLFGETSLYTTAQSSYAIDFNNKIFRQRSYFNETMVKEMQTQGYITTEALNPKFFQVMTPAINKVEFELYDLAIFAEELTLNQIKEWNATGAVMGIDPYASYDFTGSGRAVICRENINRNLTITGGTEGVDFEWIELGD